MAKSRHLSSDQSILFYTKFKHLVSKKFFLKSIHNSPALSDCLG